MQCADRFDARQLKSVTFEFLAKHYKGPYPVATLDLSLQLLRSLLSLAEVSGTQAWKDLDKELLSSITIKLFERMSK